MKVFLMLLLPGNLVYMLQRVFKFNLILLSCFVLFCFCQLQQFIKQYFKIRLIGKIFSTKLKFNNFLNQDQSYKTQNTIKLHKNDM